LGLSDKPRVLVWNKVDRCAPNEVETLLRTRGGVAISAQQASGLEALLLKADRTLFADAAERGETSPSGILEVPASPP
jgi:GTP-binding protein HflX